MTTYPRLQSSVDAMLRALWLAKGRPLSYEQLHGEYRPGMKHANHKACVIRSVRRLRIAFRAGGYPEFVKSHPGIGYSLDMAKAPTYRHQIDRIPRQDAARGALTIIPLPDSGPEFDPTCWFSKRFLEVV